MRRRGVTPGPTDWYVLLPGVKYRHGEASCRRCGATVLPHVRRVPHNETAACAVSAAAAAQVRRGNVSCDLVTARYIGVLQDEGVLPQDVTEIDLLRVLGVFTAEKVDPTAYKYGASNIYGEWVEHGVYCAKELYDELARARLFTAGIDEAIAAFRALRVHPELYAAAEGVQRLVATPSGFHDARLWLRRELIERGFLSAESKRQRLRRARTNLPATMATPGLLSVLTGPQPVPSNITECDSGD